MSITIMNILKIIGPFLLLLIASLGAEARNFLDTYGRTSLASSLPAREVSTSSPAAGKLQDDDNLLLMVTSDPWEQKITNSNCESGETCNDNIRNKLERPPAGRSPPAPKPDDPWEQKIINAACDGGRKTCSNNNIKNKYERQTEPSPPPAPKPDDPWGQMVINACDGGRKTCSDNNIKNKYERPAKSSPPPAPKPDDPWEQKIINSCNNGGKTCTGLSITSKRNNYERLARSPPPSPMLIRIRQLSAPLAVVGAKAAIK